MIAGAEITSCDRDGTEAAAELLLEPFDSSQVAHLLPPADPSLLLLLPAATASGSGGSPMGDSPGDVPVRSPSLRSDLRQRPGAARRAQ